MSAATQSDVGVLVVTHGQLAQELIEAARIILGRELEETRLQALSIGWNDDLDHSREQVRDAVAAADRGAGVLLLTDMFGGTPTNLCLSFLEDHSVEIVTGVNLPMVVKATSLVNETERRHELREVARSVAKKGAESIVLPSDVLEG